MIPETDARHLHTAAIHLYNAAIAEQDRAELLLKPSSIYRPRLSLDGNKWCALYGENPQDGVVGFGDSPALAFADFDRAWVAPILLHNAEVSHGDRERQPDTDSTHKQP